MLDCSSSDLDKLNSKNCRVMRTFVFLVYIAVASFVILAQPAVNQGASNNLPLTYPSQVLQVNDSQTCPSEEQVEILRNEVESVTQDLLRESVVPFLQGDTFSCGGSTGWRRVAYLNMSDPSQQCPSVWREYTTPHRVCGRRSNSSGTCEGLNYTTGSEQYDQVCGRIIGYQSGTPDAFIGAGWSIDSYYLDGVSLTYGSPRQHIWSFAAGVDEGNSRPSYAYDRCPCVAGSTNRNRIPSFVDQNYFCESGITQWNGSFIFWPNGDPLWDGQGCGSNNTSCTFNSPPWFNVTLPSLTTDDIEVRICSNEGNGNEDTPIQLMELYVK